MGLLDRLLGRSDDRGTSTGQRSTGYAGFPGSPGGQQGQQAQRPAQSEDERAVERYRYMLRTAPPEQVEQAHQEAFAKLTPAQRQQVLADLGSQVPASERATSDDPASLARMATRAEVRQPGTLERTFSGAGRGGLGGGGLGMGAVIGGSLLASVAGAFIGTAIAGSLLDGFDGGDDYAQGFEDGAQADAGADGGADGGYDGGGYEDAGGDFGGGDFGGGDFGGGFDV